MKVGSTRLHPERSAHRETSKLAALLTAEPAGEEPAVAATVFGSALPKARLFAALLSTDGLERGLLGPREAARIWNRHLLNCAALAEYLPAAGPVADLGSGAGLPGIVLALLRPDLEFVLVEPQRRRAEFLGDVRVALGLSHLEVLCCRAEDLAGRRVFAAVTARAVAPLGRLVRLSMPLLEPGGQLLALKGATAAAELARALPDLPAAGGSRAILWEGAESQRLPATVITVARAGHRRKRGAG